MKITNLAASVIFASFSLALLASDRDPFERPAMPVAKVLWQLRGTLVTSQQSFAFLTHPNLGNSILQSQEKLPETDWWVQQIAPGTVKLQKMNSEQMLILTLPRRQ